MIMCLAAAVQEVMGQLRASRFRALRRDHKVADVRGPLQGIALRRQSPLRSSMDSSIQNVLNTLGIRDARLIVPGHAGPAHRKMRCIMDLEGLPCACIESTNATPT